MKKRLGLLALTAVLTSVAYGASIDHIQTYTPEYLGNQAQNGMINNASVYYNPAGIVNLEKGIYVHVGAQLAVGHEKMEYNGKDYKADLFQPIPNFAMYKVEDDSALYWTFGGIAGGGDLKYDNGVAGTAVIPDIVNNLPDGKLPPELGGLYIGKVKDLGSSAEGKNLYAQTTLGKVWKIDNKLSLSAAGRLVYGIRELKGNLNIGSDDPNSIINQHPIFAEKLHADIDSERTAWGYGVQLGLNYQATEKLNLAMRYDSRVKLNFKAKGNKNDVPLLDLGFGSFYPEYVPGTKTRRDLPAILAAGMSYTVTDNWTVGLSGNYYFNKDAKIDRIKAKSALGSTPIEAEYDNGYEIAVGTEYRLNPKWAVLGGVNYAYTGAKVSSYDDVEFALDSIMVGTGLKYNPDETSEWVFTVAHYFYDSEEGHFSEKYKGMGISNPEYSKSITAFGVGYTKRF